MHHLAFGLAVVLLVLGLMSQVFGADATTSPGHKAVFASHQPTGSADPCCQVQVNGTLTKGLAHNVLTVDATFKAVPTFGCSPTDVDMFPPSVNGILMNPDALGLISASARCASGVCPTVNGNYWLDLDKAEVARPGTFIGKPLSITILGRWFGVNCAMFDTLTMSVIMFPK